MNLRFIKKYHAVSLVAFFTVLVTGWILRAQVTVVPDLIPGVNGAYYLIQARAILRTGLPGIPDFPLLFYIQAMLSGFLSLFYPTEKAILATVRLTDTVIPVLLAVPVFLFIRAFASKEKEYTPIFAALGVGLIAIGNESLLRMAGDFQKNAAGLPLFLTYAYFLYLFLKDRHRRDVIMSLLFFCLAFLTHIGVAALALLFTGLTIMVIMISDRNYMRFFTFVPVLAISLIFSLGIVYLFDPERVTKLLVATFNPGALFKGPMLNAVADFGPVNPQQRPEGIVLGNVLGLIGLVTTIAYTKRIDHATRSVLYAASITALVFASPFIERDLAQRLYLMAFVPGLIPLAFISVRTRSTAILALVAAVVLVVISDRSLRENHQQTLASAAYTELQTMKEALPAGKTMVIARHGLEWWTSWAMDTKVANNLETVMDVWNEYDAVLLIEEINPEAFSVGDFQHLHARPPGHHPSLMRRPPRGDAPIFSPAFPPVPVRKPGFHGPGNTFVPYDNLIFLKEGAYFRLSRIIEKPHETPIKHL